MDKLEALGFHEVHEMTEDESQIFEFHKLVHQPHILTDRSTSLDNSVLLHSLIYRIVWKNIEGPMVAFMTGIRAQVAARKRAVLINERKLNAGLVLRFWKRHMLGALGHYQVQPEVVDWCEFPSVKNIIDQPSEVEVTSADFSPAVDQICYDLAIWQSDIRSRLHKLVAAEEARRLDETPPPDLSLDVQRIRNTLSLASTAFGCRNCGTCAGEDAGTDDSDDDDDFSDTTPFNSMPLFYPEVLGHRCLTRTRRKNPLDQDDYSKLLHSDHGDRCHWNTKYLCLDEALCEYAARVVTSAGLDPETTTVEEMDELNGLFACDICHRKECGDDEYMTLEVYGWRHAVSESRYSFSKSSSHCEIGAAQ